MPDSIDTLCSDAIWWCENGNLGYDQSQRYSWEQSGYKTGTEVDCSSFVIGLLKKHGYSVGDASYTGNISSALTKHGWKRLPNNGNPRKGDILLNDAHHVALYVGNGKLAQASRGERGHRVSGGKAGDQDGYETNVRSYYNYPWTCYLRFAGSTSTAPKPSTSSTAASSSANGKLEVDGWWGSATTTRLQKLFRTPADGVISGQYIGNKQYVKAATSGWEFIGNYYGSTLIRAMQTRLGVTADGLIGPSTVNALERHYGFEPDGCLDGPSNTVKAMQKALNNGKF